MADTNGTTSSGGDAKRQKLDDQPQKTTLKEFEAVFPKLEADLLEHAQKYNLPKAELEWFKTVSLFPAPWLCRPAAPFKRTEKFLTLLFVRIESGDQCDWRQMQSGHVRA